MKQKITHEVFWLAIDFIAKESGNSASSLAIKSGLDPCSFNKSGRFSRKGKERWLVVSSFLSVLEATNLTLSQFESICDSITDMKNIRQF